MEANHEIAQLREENRLLREENKALPYFQMAYQMLLLVQTVGQLN